MQRTTTSRRPRSQPGGFTLVELLVALTIFLILATLTIGAFQNGSVDRVAAATGQIKAALEGARSRAIKDKQPRGIRLVVDQNNDRWCTSLLYVGASERLVGNRAENMVVFVSGSNTLVATDDDDPNTDLAYDELKRAFDRNVLTTGLRIEVGRGSGRWYTITSVQHTTVMVPNPSPPPATVPRFEMQITVAGDILGAPAGATGYTIELAPAVLPDEDPIVLPRGTVIDLDGCDIPNGWRAFRSNPPTPPPPVPYSSTMDIMFSPRGTVLGESLAKGVLHLYIAEVEDASLNAGDENAVVGLEGRPVYQNPDNYPMGTPSSPPNWGNVPVIPADPAREHRLVSVFAQTGNVIAAPVNVGSGDTNGIFNDEEATSPFLFAVNGEEAN